MPWLLEDEVVVVVEVEVVCDRRIVRLSVQEKLRKKTKP